MNKVGAANFHDSKIFRCCCGCLHVKPGTIIYGLLCLILDLFGVALLVLLTIHPDVLMMPNSMKDEVLDDKVEDNTWARFTTPEQRCINKEDLHWGYAFTMFSISATVALLYGVIRSRPCCMLPFFCIQVLGFCICALTLLTFCAYVSHADMQEYLSSTSSLAKMTEESKEMVGMNKDSIVVFTVAILVLILIVRAYLLCMIWKCYRYVQLVVTSRSSVRQYQVDPDTELLLPPPYEDAIKPQALTQFPPYSQ